MEETNSKPTYEQLELSVKFWQNRAAQAEQNLATINMATLRLDYLFKVLRYSEHFNRLFVEKCEKEIENLLDVTTSEKPVEE